MWFQGCCRSEVQRLLIRSVSHVRLSFTQVSRLQGNLQQGERDMGTAEGQISTLKEAQDKLLEELDATRARLRETSNLLSALQVGKHTVTHTHSH